METFALHCRRAIMSWMCKDEHAVMFVRNHNDSRLFQTIPCASIWISTQVFARLVLYAALSGLLFGVQGNLSRQFAHFADIVIDRACLKETKSTDSSDRNPCHTLAFPEEFRRTANFWRKAFVHGTIERRLLKNLPARMIGRERDVDF